MVNGSLVSIICGNWEINWKIYRFSDCCGTLLFTWLRFSSFISFFFSLPNYQLFLQPQRKCDVYATTLAVEIGIDRPDDFIIYSANSWSSESNLRATCNLCANRSYSFCCWWNENIYLALEIHMWKINLVEPTHKKK